MNGYTHGCAAFVISLSADKTSVAVFIFNQVDLSGKTQIVLQRQVPVSLVSVKEPVIGF